VGAGLAGQAEAAEPGDRGNRVITVDQEPEQFFGDQAFWSLAAIFSPVAEPDARNPVLEIKLMVFRRV